MMDWPYAKIFEDMFLICGLALYIQQFQYNLCKRPKTNMWSIV
jgi:hypothetical protein